MESIEADYESLAGTLPKSEYTELDNDVLGSLLRVFNDPALQKANGDVFGRIYEYFLTQFADLKAHDGGEFFTPISLVQLIVNVIEPDHGKVLDPACGSGGMFVQSAHFIESLRKDPTKTATFYGMGHLIDDVAKVTARAFIFLHLHLRKNRSAIRLSLGAPICQTAERQLEISGQ